MTAVEFDLPHVPEVVGGCLFFDGADAATVVHAWRRWTATLPEQATTSPAAADALLAGPDAPCPQAIVELRLLGGAIAGPADVSAVCHRDAAFSLLLIGVDVLPLHDAVLAHAGQVGAALAPWIHGGGLPNFGGAPTAESVLRVDDGPTLARLGALATRYDPSGVLAGGRSVRAALS